MIISLGIDIVEIGELKKSIERSTRFLDRVYTQNEISYCENKTNKYSSFATRFAAKEAVMKALGTGWGKGVHWKQIEVINEDRAQEIGYMKSRVKGVKGEQYTISSGKPRICFNGRALKLAERMGIKRIVMSLSHSMNYATACVIFEGDPGYELN